MLVIGHADGVYLAMERRSNLLQMNFKTPDTEFCLPPACCRQAGKVRPGRVGTLDYLDHSAGNLKYTLIKEHKHA